MFELATEGAAILAEQAQYREPLRRYGTHFGNAFQIIDDILDYTSDAETLGKNIGDDLMEGKPTLPLISALQRLSPDSAEHQLIAKSIQTGGIAHLSQIIDLVHQTSALDYCRQRAEQETQYAIDALQTLPDSPYRQGLENLAKLALQRLA